MAAVPALRIAARNSHSVQRKGDYVLYWCTAQRRTGWNFALQRALECTLEFDRPLVVLDALRVDYRWASDRLHSFALGAIADNARAYARHGVQHYAYVEPRPRAGKGLLAALSARACTVITDEFPCFMHPRMLQAAAAVLRVRLESVDGCGILPLRSTEQVFPTAYAFRRFLQKNLLEHLRDSPEPEPMRALRRGDLAQLPAHIEREWPRANAALLVAEAQEIAKLPIDHSVPAVPMRGGSVAARAQLELFLNRRLVDYEELRNEPNADAASGLSPYLHFGMLSAHQVFAELAQREEWTPVRLSSKTHGKRSGWWFKSTTAESFLDQMLTWRELGFNFCSKRADFDQYESLPVWARTSLEQHASDPRSKLYDLAQLETFRTHDPLWNAAQNELRTTGRMHNYLRMLWGKKILEWSPTPRLALEWMIELNNKYALDGRDPNSYSGIFWCLGRYDRAWGPERPVYGKVRYMTSANTARKFNLEGYLKRFGVRPGSFAD
jgi:deoxyribodipyrimidine photo-lyase